MTRATERRGSDFNRAKQFYGEGLGCPIEQDHGQFASFNLGDGSAKLYLWKIAAAVG